MSGAWQSSVRPTAVVAAMVGVCCGLPALVAVGVVDAVAGVGTGNWLIAGLAAALGVGAFGRRRTLRRSDGAVTAPDDVRVAPGAER